MSFMKGDLLTKTRKLVKGLAKPQPLWLKAMEQAPPPTFPRAEGKVNQITLPEDVYVKRFFQKHPESKYHDAVKLSEFKPPPARIFGQRVVELKEQGVNEEAAISLADLEYRSEKKAKKQAYKRLKEIAKLEGKEPPKNPYPSALKETQEEERAYVKERFHNPRVLDIIRKMKETKEAEMRDRMRDSGY